MIGQAYLQQRVQSDIKFFRFLIITGQRGSGRKTLSHLISKWLNATEVISGIGVEDVREVISMAYKLTEETLYVFPDADKMSIAAKNALLKVTEEPPNKARFIITLEDKNNTLETILSRGHLISMQPYTGAELREYCAYKHPTMSNEEQRIACGVCSTPGEIDLMCQNGVTELYEYANKVVDMIATVSGSNSFKIASKIRMKDSETDKFDMELFLRAFHVVCASRLPDDCHRYYVGINITSGYVQKLCIKGINKASLFDMWILDIRKVWM